MPLEVAYTDFPAQFNDDQLEILAAVQKVFEKGHFILGEEVERFEEEFARLCGAKHAIAVANGTDSLILALKAIDLQKGDEVITASNSWVSSASSVALLGGTPVFVDVQSDQNIDPKKIEAVISKKTKAILPVHLTGRCADMVAINQIAKKHQIPVIEDAAQAICASRDDILAGSSGLMGSFSLHPLKNLNAAGDAGVLTTQDDEIAKKLRLLRNHGLKNRDEIVQWGYNSRLDELQAAILRTRIPKLKSRIEKRRQIAKMYRERLSKIVTCPTELKGEHHTYHLFVIQCDQRDKLRDYLQKRQISTKIHYPIPIHLQEAASYLGYKKGSLPETEQQAERILSLPIHSHLSDAQVDWVSQSILDFYSE